MTDGNQPETTPTTFDPELFKAEVEGFLEGTIQKLTEHFQGQLDNFKLDLQTTPEPQKSVDSEADPVQLRLKQLEQKLADYEAREASNLEQQRKQKYLDSIAIELDKVPNLQFRQSVMGLLAGTYEGAKEVNGQFLSKDGKPISDVVKDWLATDYGKHHIKPDPMASTGLKPTAETPLGVKATMSIQEKLAQGL